jgi:hypothetical protein
MPWTEEANVYNLKLKKLFLHGLWLELWDDDEVDIYLSRFFNTLPLPSITSTQKRKVCVEALEIIFGDKQAQRTAYLEASAYFPIYNLRICLTDYPIDYMWYTCKPLLEAWESLDLDFSQFDNLDEELEEYPLKGSVILKILRNIDSMDNNHELLKNRLEPHLENIRTHMLSMLTDIEVNTFLDQDWEMYNPQYTSNGIDEDYFEFNENQYVSGENVLEIMKKYDTLLEKEEHIETKKLYLEKMGKIQASNIIKKNCHNWLWAPICKDGKPSINCKLGWDEIESLNR